MKKFIKFHVLSLLDTYDYTKGPLDGFCARYFAHNRAIGSHDRKAIRDAIYTLVKWQALFDANIDGEKTWENRIHLLPNLELLHLQAFKHPLHIQYSIPKYLYEGFCSSMGEEKAKEMLAEANGKAPLTIRANSLKTSRPVLMKKLSSDFLTTLCPHAPQGLFLEGEKSIYTFPLFKEGYFEIQDEGSQLVANEIKAKPGEWVLDYCSGSGGKSLAIAANMQNKGQIFLHDIRPHIFVEAKKRLKRAGVQNAQLLPSEKLNTPRYHQSMDWILVDAPCSGSGTLRRHPELRWRITKDFVEELTKIQKEIVLEALSYLKPGGVLVYATCSVLEEENDAMVTFIEKHTHLRLTAPPFKSFLKDLHMDGFFSASFS